MSLPPPPLIPLQGQGLKGLICFSWVSVFLLLVTY